MGKMDFHILPTFADVEVELRRIHGTGEHSINNLAELFAIGSATVSRTLQRYSGR